MPESPAVTEFERQVAVLLEKGYPALTGRTDEEFAAVLAPLRAVVTGRDLPPAAPGRAPFVLVPGRDLAPAERTVPLLRLARGRKPGLVDRHYAEGELPAFVPTEQARPPGDPAHVLFDADRGEEFCGAVPNDAMAAIAGKDRTLLTIEEGVALVTQFPELLEKNKCFSLGGSRCGDRRVPALWISERAPKLGWCWEGNPHTWLGMAHAAGRAAA
ncbi:DUF5701 family protein [Actinomadura flavalba]|uniref:DUF5701 family protein n=1 Tax=Actinomadura flavalba TaxID=1120938 RepID=UPI000380C498|nr:DUF5701 family protein [Actinomadura flavalba]